MKKPITLLVLVLLMGVAEQAVAQLHIPHTPDTVRYGDSNYYFSPRYGTPTFNRCTIQNEMHYSSAWLHLSILFSTYQTTIYSCYADSTITLHGFAWPSYLFSDSMAIALMKKDSMGLFSIVDSVHVHRPATHTCLLLEGFIHPDTSRPFREAIPLYKTYFHQTHDVSDSFYFAWRNLTPSVWAHIAATIHTNSITDSTVYYRYNHSTSDLFTETKPHFWRSVFPILTKGSPYIDSVACHDTVEGFELYTQHDGIAGFTWDTLSSALWLLSRTTGYQVSCGPAENDIEDNEICTISGSRHVAGFTGLEPNREYKASIRAQCHHHCNAHDTTLWGAWQTPVYFTTGDTVSIALPEDAANDIMLLPNPADEQVTLRSTLPITHLTLCDLQGNILLSLTPQQNELTLPPPPLPPRHLPSLPHHPKRHHHQKTLATAVECKM